MRIIGVAALAIGLAAVGGGYALAQAEDRARTHAGPFKVAADYIGVSRAELFKELKGKSLAQVAVAHGKTQAGLEQALLDALEAKVDARRAAGRLSAARAARILSRAPERIHRFVERVWDGNRGRNRRQVAGLFKVAADYLGLTRSELRAQLPGRSLAQLAQQRGKSVEGLKRVLLDAARAKVDRLAASRPITADRKARLLERASRRIDRFVQHVWPQQARRR